MKKKQELEDERNALLHLLSELKGEPLDIPQENFQESNHEEHDEQLQKSPNFGGT